MNNFIEFLDYKIELLDELRRLGELPKLDSLNKSLIEFLCEMMRCIDLHHGVSQGHNVSYHCLIHGPLGFQEGMQLPLGDIRWEVGFIFGSSRYNLDLAK